MNTPFHLQKLEYREVDLELTKPLVTSSARYETRSLLLVRAQIRAGEHLVEGFGEVSPLPGWSDETLANCIETLDAAPTDVEFDAVRALDEVLPTVAELPSLRFGVELALLDALARLRETPICRLLASERGRMPLASVSVQATIGAKGPDETVAAARAAADEGFNCVKLKVGALPIATDIARIARVREACPTLMIRLDANGAWTPQQAREVLEGLWKLNIDIVEQPVAPEHFDTFVDEADALTAACIAPDESCVPAAHAHELIDAGKIGAVVLKPQALGGLLPTSTLIDDALRKGVRVVLSTLLESAVGRSAVAHLAAAYPDVLGPHGLATGGWFASDLAEAPDSILDGSLRLRHGSGLGFEPDWRSA
ncbi:o-succinylbenzoate synthase [Persicimonas caeni]|uniref:o-succinylbenzoate synthase n=1 Tax=Persicimonas caeni TaxID=2292766 RepID=A0A4Y6Q1R2_PERCE|nr:o-succinylbenzoate synthase [Persicimonas caeni]QDG54399.1 o-succinylbenzoate synthase [Persicimonas caeni]QED35620.1 o-succinylbenzoate synthase [Persicimonas caeni]